MKAEARFQIEKWTFKKDLGLKPSLYSILIGMGQNYLSE